MKIGSVMMKYLSILLVTFLLAPAVTAATSSEQENLSREKVANAEILYKTGNFEKAEKQYLEAIKVHNAGWVWVELAKFYSKTEQFEKLLKVTGIVSKKYPLLNGEVVDIHNQAIEHLQSESKIEPNQLKEYYRLADLIWKGKNSLASGKTVGNVLFDEIATTSRDLGLLLTQGQGDYKKFEPPQEYLELEAVQNEQVKTAKALLQNNKIKLASIANSQAIICEAMATKIEAETFFQRQRVVFKPQATPKEICLNSSFRPVE